MWLGISTNAFPPETNREESAPNRECKIGDIECPGSDRPDTHVQKVSHHSVRGPVNDVSYASCDEQRNGNKLETTERTARYGNGEESRHHDGPQSPEYPFRVPAGKPAPMLKKPPGFSM